MYKKLLWIIPIIMITGCKIPVIPEPEPFEEPWEVPEIVIPELPPMEIPSTDGLFSGLDID